jgi:hypothetical protein
VGPAAGGDEDFSYAERTLSNRNGMGIDDPGAAVNHLGLYTLEQSAIDAV